MGRVRVRIARNRRRPRAALGLGALVVAVALGTLPGAAFGDDSGNSLATIHVGAGGSLSITVSPSSFDYCSSATPLTFPNGTCDSPALTVTMTGADGQVKVLGYSAVPTGGGTTWTLCGGTAGAPACTGSDANNPGTDEYAEIQQPNGLGGTFDTGSWLPGNSIPACDENFGSSTECSATTGESKTEYFLLAGPTLSSSAATTFTTQITWYALP